MLLSGTTTICDGYFHEDIVAAVVNESGLNGIIAQGIIDFPAPGVPDPSLKIQNAIDYVPMIKNRYLNILPSIFCHSPYTCSTKTLMDAKKAAKLHKVINLDPNVADAVSIFKMATINGARSIGIGEEPGFLEAGKKADIGVQIINFIKPDGKTELW